MNGQIARSQFLNPWRVTGWGFAVIGVPILIFLFFTLRILLKGLGKLTGLTDNELMLPR